MLQRDGDVMAKVVPNARKKTLQPLIESHVAPGSTVHSDELASYQGLAAKGYDHQTVNHGAEEFARDDCHVNTLEGFWARLKLSIRGTHVHVSGKHLQKYVGEFEYRYNSREEPEKMLPELLTTFPPHDEE
jgi:transposase